jgi:uncharacterized caspase-like protein
MISGTTQVVKVTSEPDGANIYVNNKDIHTTTPAKIKIKRKVKSSEYNERNQYNYTLKREGYDDITISDFVERNPTVWLNFIFFYLTPVSLPVDFISGAANKYSPHIHGNLHKIKTDTIIKKEIVYMQRVTKEQYIFNKKSDIDKNIPVTPSKYNNRFALIIGNEDYSTYQTGLSNEINVEFARNDASAFKEYAINVLGIPAENIIFLLDATSAQMHRAIAKTNLILKNTNGQAELFVYYAGHGLPDEQTKEPYIIPVDVSGKYITEGISLKDMYKELTLYPSKRVTVFIDACFSGGARNQGLLAARGVKIIPKEAPLKGNLVAFNAGSGEQSSLPYKQKEHGIFTYFLLKKIQETKGQISYKELADYITNKVALKSVLINDKEQNPKVNVSADCQKSWENWRLIE